MNVFGSTFACSIRSFSLAGLLFVYLISPTIAQSWQQVDKLIANDATAMDQFGAAVALQGTVALIGADSDDDAGNNSGSAYLFEDDGMGNWSQLTKLVAGDAAMGDRFGTAVALSGNTALVGAFGDDGFAGSAYLFQDSGTWSQIEKLMASDAVSGDQFGFSAALEGNAALVGAPLGDKGALADVGAAYLFQDDGSGNWQETKLTASDAVSTELDQFGSSVALAGNLALVGAWRDGDAGSDAGAAYLFEKDGLGTWNQIAKLMAGDAQPDDFFGFSVAISGNTALIGAPLGNTGAGAAYLFQDDGSGNWNQIAKLTAADATAFSLDQFGASVALENGTALVGAFSDSDDGLFSGSAYLFQDDGIGNWSQVEKLTADDAAANDLFGEAVALDGNTTLVGAIGSSGKGGAYVFTQFSAADFNEDGNVDGLDLASWETGYGTAAGASRMDGDADEDEDVDGSDFLIWQREFGSPGPLSSLRQVPEPSSLLLVTTSFFVIVWKARRKRFASSVVTKHNRLIF